MAEARLAMHPVEPRGVAARIIRVHGRHGHTRTIKALIDCINEQQAEVAPTIPRTLGLIAKPGDEGAAVALRGCLHAVKVAVPTAEMTDRALQHWHAVQTSLMRQTLAALDRLGEEAVAKAPLPLARIPQVTEWRAHMDSEDEWPSIEESARR